LRRRLLYLIPIAALGACVLVAMVAFVEAFRWRSRPFPGFLYQESLAISPLQRARWPGRAHGIAPRQRVLALDGEAVADGRDLSARLSRKSVGEAVRVTLTDGVERRERTVVLGRFDAADFSVTFLLPFTIGLVYLLIGGVIFFVKRTRPAALVMSICVVAAAFYLSTFDAQTTFALTRVWLCYPLLGAVAFHLFSVFPEERAHLWRARVLAVPYALAALVIAGRQAYARPSPAGFVAAVAGNVYLTAAFVACIVTLLQTLNRTASQVTRNKAKVLLVGLLASVACGLVYALVAHTQPRLLTVERVLVLSAFFPVLMGYAALKHDLFDMDAVLRTTLTYGVLTTLVIGTYVGAVAAVGLALSPPGAVAAVVFTLLGVVVFHPLRLQVQGVFERLLLRERGDLGRAARRLVHELPEAVDVAELSDRLASGIGRLLRCRSAALLFADRPSGAFVCLHPWGDVTAEVHGGRIALDGAFARALLARPRPLPLRDLLEEPEASREAGALLRELGAEVIVPLVAESRPVGFLALGSRKHGDVFTYAEMGLLRDLAPAAAVAVDRAVLLREHAGRERLAALGQVAAVMIHEIKNPLGIIKIATGTIRKRLTSDDTGLELTRCIEEEVDRMNATLGQILAFARPRAPDLQPVNVRDLAERAVSRLRPELEGANVRASVSANGSTWAARADAGQIEQVLVNLILNARHAMPQGGDLSIDVRGVRRGLTRRGVQLVVEDGGVGMTEETRARIFQPFFSTRPGGTGLGLAIVKQILDEHRAEIDVESEPGRGARFVVTLPAADR
jgi:signal transduction histidine kinase